MTKLKEKIDAVKKFAPTQPDIILCAQIFSVCDAAKEVDRLIEALDRITTCRLKDGDMMVDIANIALKRTKG